MLVQKILTIMVWHLFHTSFYLFGHFTIISLIWIQNCCRDQKIPFHIWGFPFKRIPYLRNNEYNKIKREKMGLRSSLPINRDSLKSGSHKPEFDCIKLVKNLWKRKDRRTINIYEKQSLLRHY